MGFGRSAVLRSTKTRGSLLVASWRGQAATHELHLKYCIGFCMCDDGPTVNLLGDSSAARALINRQGTGRIKRLEGRILWLQQKVQEQLIRPGVVSTTWDLSDICTKSHAAKRSRMLQYFLGYCDEEFRQICAELDDRQISQVSGSNSTLAKRLLKLTVMKSLVQPTLCDDALSLEKTEAYPFEWLIYFCFAFTFVCMVWLCIRITLKLKRWFSLYIRSIHENKFWITRTGKKYHKKSCKWLASGAPTMIFESDAIKNNYTKCKTCFPESIGTAKSVAKTRKGA